MAENAISVAIGSPSMPDAEVEETKVPVVAVLAKKPV